MILHEAQKKILADNHRFRVVNCGRRFGKTTFAVEEIKGYAMHKDARIAYIAPTFAQARDIAWQMLISELKPIITKVNETRLELEVKNIRGGTSLIILRGWEAVETLRGQKFDFLVVDEIASMRNYWAAWQEVVRPTLTDTRGQALFISTPKGYNHFYDLFNMEKKDDDFKSFNFSSYDNPHIPSDEVDKAKLEMTEERFAQEYLAEFSRSEGRIYKEFKRDVHVIEPFAIPHSWKKIRGGDHGERNPTAVLWCAISPAKELYFYREYYKAGEFVEYHAEQVAEMSKGEYYEYTVFDPSIKSVRGGTGKKIDKEWKDAMKQREKNFILRYGINDVSVGIARTHKYLRFDDEKVNPITGLYGSPRMFIFDTCVNLIHEFERYEWKTESTTSEDDAPEKPRKKDDHAMDACRYIIMSRPLEDSGAVHSTNKNSIAKLKKEKRDQVLSEDEIYLENMKKLHPEEFII